jgi:hypothetical protein
MPRYEIHAIAEGSATIAVEAENKERAEEIAYSDHLTGIAIEGGESTWNIESIEEV